MLQVYLVIGLLHCMLVTMMFEFIADRIDDDESFVDDIQYFDEVLTTLKRISAGGIMTIVTILTLIGETTLLWPVFDTVWITGGLCSALRHSK